MTTPRKLPHERAQITCKQCSLTVRIHRDTAHGGRCYRCRNKDYRSWMLALGYASWKGMIERCEKRKGYADRGIRVCERWRESFTNFVEDMGRRPSATHTIDRIDNDGDYEPSNCRWATPKEQQRNTRRTLMLTINGATKPLGDWADEHGLDRRLIYLRIRKGKTGSALIAPRDEVRSQRAVRSIALRDLGEVRT